jgi:hypothetical protein
LIFEEEREKLVAWNPWAMESPGGMRRDYVFRILELWKMQTNSTTSPSNHDNIAYDNDHPHTCTRHLLDLQSLFIPIKKYYNGITTTSIPKLPLA